MIAEVAKLDARARIPHYLLSHPLWVQVSVVAVLDLHTLPLGQQRLLLHVSDQLGGALVHL